MKRTRHRLSSLNLLVGICVLLQIWPYALLSQNACQNAPRKRHSVRRNVNPDLELAKIYMRLENWTEAEQHFVLAAKDPLSQKEALAGVEESRKRANSLKLLDDAAPLGVAKAY